MDSSPTAPSVLDLVRERLREDPGSPLVTFVDHGSGERTELSAATLHNWAAKTANLLVEEFDVAPGDRVGLSAGPHWSTAAVVLGVWEAGACVVPGTSAGVRVAVVEENAPGDGPGAGAGAAVGSISAAPLVVVGTGMGARSTGPLPTGALGYGEEVLAFADDYDDPDVHGGLDAALLDGVRLTQGNLLAAVAAYGAWGLGDAGRVLVTGGPETVEGLLGVLGPFAWGGGVVVVRDADPDALWATIATERVTAAVLPAGLLDGLGAPRGETPLRHVLCPSGAARDVVRRAAERTGVPVAVGHGLVGATCASSLPPATADQATGAWLARSAAPTVGPPLPGVEVTVESPDGPVEDGRRGEVVVRGPVVSPDAGGALRTGDEGFLEAGPDGRPWLFLTGRA